MHYATDRQTDKQNKYILCSMLIGIEKLREKNNRRLPWIAAEKFRISDYLIIWNKSASKGTPVILQGILLTTKMLNHKFLKEYLHQQW